MAKVQGEWGACFILSPMVWPTLYLCQRKTAYSWVSSLRPQRNAKPTAQLGKLRLVPTGRGQELLCLYTFRGQSVRLSIHPSSGHYPPPSPFRAPPACPQRPPYRECDERPIYYTSARTVVTDVSNSSAPSHICSWLKSEEKETRKKSLHFTQPLSHAQTSTSPPPPLPQTAEAHALRFQCTPRTFPASVEPTTQGI